MTYSLSFRLKSYLKWVFNFFIGFGNAKVFIRILTAYRIYRKAGGPGLRSEEADNIIWMYYPNFKSFRSNFYYDLLLAGSVASLNKKFTLYKKQDIGKYKDKCIFYGTEKYKMNPFGFDDYAGNYVFISQKLEEQKNRVFPSYHDTLYWENKIYMYSKFVELGVKTPKTSFYNNFNTLVANEATFPFLIKVPHSSGSYGLFNVIDKQYLDGLVNDPIILANTQFITQERLNITMDLRVILIGGEIVHYYWRKNKDKSKWQTTSTSSGSAVDFANFPEPSRAKIIDAFKKLDLLTGAFDVGWQNDDINTDPYFFEVSPSYDINPKTSNIKHLENYGKYKKELLLKDSYDQLFVEQTYEIKRKAIAEFFRRNGK